MSLHTEIILPVVSNIREAQDWANDFKAILTVGPEERDVRWGHKNHKVFTFGDTTGGHSAPKLEDIEQAITWGATQEDLLVHCHAGMSRSTSTAWGISILRGVDPLEAFLLLKKAQPNDYWRTARETVARDFIPNRLIVSHLEKILGITGLEEIRKEHSTRGWNY
jgi:predicted protein tyrosine phosphatase